MRKPFSLTSSTAEGCGQRVGGAPWKGDSKVSGVDATQFTFEGFEAVAARVRAAAGGAAYLVVQDRTVRGRDVRLGRHDLADDSEEATAAAVAWLADLAVRNTVGEPWRRFRVKVWGPKGLRLVDSGQFVCRNGGVAPEAGERAVILRFAERLRASGDRVDLLVASVLEERMTG